ncbi:MAG: GNAT family N-acetyltransferase [Halarcobacter sp.]
MKNEYIIRKAKINDIESLLILFQKHAAFEKSDFILENKKEKLEKYLFNTDILNCLVIEINNTIIAYATYFKQFSTWDVDFYLYLDCLFIEKDFRNLGLGKKIIDVLKEVAKKLNCSFIQWQTPSFNEKAIKFYNKVGAKSKNKERFFLGVL